MSNNIAGGALFCGRCGSVEVDVALTSTPLKIKEASIDATRVALTCGACRVQSSWVIDRKRLRISVEVLQ